jgi:16S rRNA (guanine527-N7)-methyltransferase
MDPRLRGDDKGKIMQILSNALAENNLSLDEPIQQKLLAYLDLITTWNKVFNLTNILNPREMVYLHLIDSLAIAPYLHGSRLLDVGSGAGLPGIPLALVHPEQEWVLLDKNSKKTRFLTQAVAELGLRNVQVVHSRSEDFQPAVGFDSILSRAYGTLSMFTETTQHLLRENGIFVAMKGKYPQDEVQALPADIVVKSIHQIDINGMDIERHIVCLQKTRED